MNNNSQTVFSRVIRLRHKWLRLKYARIGGERLFKFNLIVNYKSEIIFMVMVH